MIVVINGDFGVGKTTTALLLRERIAPSLLYDPEEIGFTVLRSCATSRPLTISGTIPSGEL